MVHFKWNLSDCCELNKSVLQEHKEIKHEYLLLSQKCKKSYVESYVYNFQ